MIAAEQAPFQTLIKLIERELELAGQGKVVELQAAVEKTGAFITTLPQPAPASARALALRAEALRGRVAIETIRLQESIGRSRASLRRGRSIARRYRAPRSGRISTSA